MGNLISDVRGEVQEWVILFGAYWVRDGQKCVILFRMYHERITRLGCTRDGHECVSYFEMCKAGV